MQPQKKLLGQLLLRPADQDPPGGRRRDRPGGLDQGNIILNLADADRRGLTGNVLFLAGAAERRGFHALREALRQRYPGVESTALG